MCNYNFGGYRFEWDGAKERMNIEKHGVDFKAAASTWADENALVREDVDHSWDEFRMLRFGLSLDMNLLMVVHCYRQKNGSIRIISARKCTNREEALYAEFRGMA